MEMHTAGLLLQPLRKIASDRQEIISDISLSLYQLRMTKCLRARRVADVIYAAQIRRKHIKWWSLISGWNWVTCLLKIRVNKYSCSHGLISIILQNVSQCCVRFSAARGFTRSCEFVWSQKLFVTMSTRSRVCLPHHKPPSGYFLFFF